MPRNQKLTRIIAGRTIAQVRWEAAIATVRFGDGSVMRIHAAAPPPAGAPVVLGKVRAVRQSATTISLDLGDGASLEISLGEATSSVMLRDAKGVLEYAD